ncbi:MAG: aminoacyl-tRNA hydrolase, partial [Rhodobacteraceae bacterium]|nr:aminoacyl-tRNA hydrolase [Paracoccaceae bacterium]
KDRVAAYVLSDFAKADQDWLDDMMRGIADGAPALAEGDGPRFSNAVGLRMTPPKPKVEKPIAPPKQQDPAPTSDARSPLQKLVDRFK